MAALASGMDQRVVDCTNDAKQDILQGIDEVASAIVSHVVADETASGILTIISRASAEFRTNLDFKIEELLEPHLSGHHITYNHYMTDNVQKAQEERRCRKLAKDFEGPD